MTNLGKYRSLVLMLLSRHLDALEGEVNVAMARKETTGMPHIPDARVDEHQGRLEHVEEDLVAEQRAHPAHSYNVVDLSLAFSGRVLEQTVDAADQDESHAGVQGPQHGIVCSRGPDVRVATASHVEESGHAYEDDHEADLDGDGGDGKMAADSSLFGGRRRVRIERDSD